MKLKVKISRYTWQDFVKELEREYPGHKFTIKTLDLTARKHIATILIHDWAGEGEVDFVVKDGTLTQYQLDRFYPYSQVYRSCNVPWKEGAAKQLNKYKFGRNLEN